MVLATTAASVTLATFAYHFLKLVELAFVARAILRPHRQPASRIAWVVVIATVPVLGILSYVLFGETNIGRRRVARSREVIGAMPALASASQDDRSNLDSDVPERYRRLFGTVHSISGFPTFGGNSARLFGISDETIEAMVSDIDAAQEHVHVLFYIWLADNNGCKVVEALKRAAGRGVKCRAMADGLGSRAMIASEHWRSMREAGVHVAVALPIGKPDRGIDQGTSRSAQPPEDRRHRRSNYLLR